MTRAGGYPRAVTAAAGVEVVGKESNEFEAVQAGLIHDPDEVQERYGYLGRDFFDEGWYHG